MGSKERVLIWTWKEIVWVRFMVGMNISMFFMNLYMGDLLISGCDTFYFLDYFRCLNYCFGGAWLLVLYNQTKKRRDKYQ